MVTGATGELTSTVSIMHAAPKPAILVHGCVHKQTRNYSSLHKL